MIKSPDTELVMQLPFGSHTQEFLQRVNLLLEGEAQQILIKLNVAFLLSIVNYDNLFALWTAL